MKAEKMKGNGLYNPAFEHDNCGIGAVVNIKGVKTHITVSNALKIVEQLEHRAGKDAKGETGDGVGILTQVPYAFFKKIITEFPLPHEGKYGVGMFFFPQDRFIRNQAKKMFESIVEKEGMKFLGWRVVPNTPSVLGTKALEAMPYIMQGFVKKPENVERGLEFDRKLYVARRVFEQSNEDTYVCSLSSRTIVYKGMFLVGQLRSFFNDLQDEDYKSAIALVHSRFSTNTMPSWDRAHPNRFIVHNGEINTIRGNANNMLCREENMKSDVLDTDKVYPVVNVNGSDSAMLDNTLEFFVMAGMELPRAVMMCIPEPWENDDSMSQLKKDFYAYNSTVMEPWDGPASILFSDGDIMGAVLDRNGLRPSRYYITRDDYLVLSSEVGALDIADEDIVVKDRLRPGKMLLVDTKKGELIQDHDLKTQYASQAPYGEWLDSHLIQLKDIKIPNQKVIQYRDQELLRLQKVYGYGYEDIKDYIIPTALNGIEPVIAMGNDAPLAVLSKKHQPLFNYFKQLFAQVTNPPIDAIREEIVTSTSLCIGTEGNILEDSPENCHLLKIHNPILTNTDILKIKNLNKEGFKAATLSMLYYKNTSLEKAIDRLFVEADKAYYTGANILILSDRGVDDNHVAIPSLLATGALNQYLVKTKKRMKIALIVESGEPREVHHYATLLGYGASAVNGYLVQDTIFDLIQQGMIEKDYYAAVNDYNSAILHGIIKIASKMGISTIQSYRGSQIFEAIGINQEVIQRYFPHTVSRVEGISLQDIQSDVDYRHRQAFDPLGLEMDLSLESQGNHKERSAQEKHLYNPQTIHLLQQSTRTNDYEMFKQYTKLIDQESEGINLRGLLEFDYKQKSIPLEEVESVEQIVKRFKTGAMSYGSISKEAHETMAIAMNMLHGKSNSGEGGEDPDRFIVGADGKNRCSAIKQVASGRFGVTNEYLCSAQEIQIKMAQGAKPGEGGQLPAGKVYPWVAKTRHSTPGVGLISPPPHHDIYSIEDLAQLIYDLKNVNQKARISVKLVSEAGVGTVAAGVAKAGAGVILISGYDGGTGAAPKNSVYNAGLPWELGLAEAHQTLIMNGLRNRVVLETDGKLMSGRDLAIATLLGAEEYGFATAPLVTMGCVMMRVCNLDTCPVGVATQNPILRKRFTGKPEYIVNFMRYVAEELREYMAQLGFKTIDEMVGRTDLLKMKNIPTTQKIDLSCILNNPYAHEKERCYNPKNSYDFQLEKVKDTTVLLKQMKPAIIQNQKCEVELEINNIDRSFGTILGSYITQELGQKAKDDQYRVRCYGAGGQSFGAFIPQGLTLDLVGDSNDYFGKGLSGGKLIVKPPKESLFKAEENIIIGNVALYGATSGEVYINGVAGERFAVRNSGAKAVVEGVGDHGLEYMTGGTVVILGETGRNLAAGMSGGIAYVYDPDNQLYEKLNSELVKYSQVESKYDKAVLKEMIEKHYHYTQSQKAHMILESFDEKVIQFKKIVPYDYQKMIDLIASYEKQGLSEEQAKIEAFYASKKG
jgi:glutamate synthase (NADPH/NADH) large chain